MSLMGTKNGRKQHSAEFKAKVALAAIKGQHTTVKYEDIYLHDYATVAGVITGLNRYFAFYNTKRQHQALDYRTPQEVYEGQKIGGIRTLCAA